MNIPDGILCSTTHEWVLEENENVTIGLTDLMVEQLGDIIFIELPEISSFFEKNEVFAIIKSVKAVNELYMPISGTIIEINESLINSPELINEDAFSSWLIKVKPENLQKDLQGLLEYNDYRDEI